MVQAVYAARASSSAEPPQNGDGDDSRQFSVQDGGRDGSMDAQTLPTNHDRNGSADGVTVGQKMLSAIAGSVLTALLVTPLDVVRIRLQSQQPQPQPQQSTPSSVTNSSSSCTTYTIRPIHSSSLGSTIPSASGTVASFRNLPPNLGVTACCREVFWLNNNNGYCLVESVGPHSTTPFSATAAECAVEETERRTFTSTFDGIRKIARNEGFTTLWRGLSPTLVMAVPGNVIYFAGYDWLRTSNQSPLHKRVSETWSPLIAGSSARVLAAIVVSPIELFRTRMQASRATNAAENFRQTLAGVHEMTGKYGYTSLWRGLTLTLWRDVPFSALYWWGYEAVRNSLISMRIRSNGLASEAGGSLTSGSWRNTSIAQNHSMTLVDSFVSGAVSGAAASVVTTPFDVGKTRQQVYRHSMPDNASAFSGEVPGYLKPEDRSMPRFLWHIFREEGAAGLFRGWIPRTLKVAPACAIMISSYEMGKKMAYTNATSHV